MKNQLRIISFIAGSAWILSMNAGRSSSGAPPSHTGAPGEQTCATSNCHDDYSINSGTALLEIVCTDGAGSYIPGQTYSFKVSINDTGKERFGFQVVALDAATHSNAGTFTITDPAHTQLLKNYRQLTNRRYVTYSFHGTDAVSTGRGEWVFNWTAPSTNIGAVGFYVTAVSANDDETDHGDFVYSTTLIFPPQ